MAGSEESGEEMQSGRTNRAEDHTRIWAQQEQGQPFNGDAIFVVEGAGDIEDDDFVHASSRLHGILGKGVNEGVGVIGLDADHSGQDLSQLVNVGVFGSGERGVLGEGARGPGVEGIGGNRPFLSRFGAGVIGRGGRQDDEDNEQRKQHGPGVVGIGGGRARKLENDSIVESVGVFGQGAEAEVRTVDGTVHGPTRAGAGVVGRGGVSLSHGGLVAPGVVGWAGGSDNLPVLAFEGNMGVIGFGATGVYGEGSETGVKASGDAIGLHGLADKGRGGVFESLDITAQLRLIPHVQETPTPQLPREGMVGDLLLVRSASRDEEGRDTDECSLWLCVPENPRRDSSSSWREVQLGTIVTGTL